MYQHLMKVSPITILDNVRSDTLPEYDNVYSYIKKTKEYKNLRESIHKKHNPLVKPKPKYKALDFDDNILGEAFTMEDALEIFYTRYAVFDKKAALEFIEKI